MIRLKLPFEYVRVSASNLEREAEQLVKQVFGIELENAKICEISDFSKGFYHCKVTEGFTLVTGAKFSIMALNIDGEADGVYEEFNQEAILIQNHPCLVLCVKDAKIYHVSGAPVEVPFDPSGLAEFVSSKHLDEEIIDKYNSAFSDSSVITLESFSTLRLDLNDSIRVGPADYRSFKVEANFNKMCELFTNLHFIKFLSEISGLPLGLPVRPPYTRIISAAGDYQILHGNYSEPFGLDCIFTAYPGQKDGFQWPEETCGHIHYLDDEGSEIFQVPNGSNSLTLVYRTEGVVRFLENIKGTQNQPLIQVLATFAVLE